MKLNIWSDLPSLIHAAEGIVRIEGETLTITDERAFRDRLIDDLVVNAVFAEDPVRSVSRWMIRVAAPKLGAYPSSIHQLYVSAATGAYRNATAPAMNLRGVTYEMMRAAFRAARKLDAKILLFELARSEMGYTQQRPGEYASNALAAAIKENWRGPVFIQGDHYQISAKKHAVDPQAEITAVRDLIAEAIAAGYYNIDVDASTIVDLSLPTLRDQQVQNAAITAEMTTFIRQIEPKGITVSVGGEIGEVGHRNSTVEDLDAFMGLYTENLATASRASGREVVGLSKVSVATGTHHGGIILPDGSMQDVAVDFQVLADLSVAAHRYGMGGAVQHGASTVPMEFFNLFSEANAIEVHLASAFQTIFFEHPAFPKALRVEINDYLFTTHGGERKAGQNDTQFLYGSLKHAWGPFKRQLWEMPDDALAQIMASLEERFGMIMSRLGVANTSALVDRTVSLVDVATPAPEALGKALRGESVAGGGKETHELHDEGE
ncbi:MAG: class II fructose-bisphosphate aldolase [Chloroflexota bacterium]